MSKERAEAVRRFEQQVEKVIAQGWLCFVDGELIEHPTAATILPALVPDGTAYSSHSIRWIRDPDAQKQP